MRARRRRDPARRADRGGRRHVRRPHHRPCLPARGDRRAGGRDVAGRARPPVRPGRRRRVPRVAGRCPGDPRALRSAAGAVPRAAAGRGGHAGHAAGRGQRARDLPEPPAALGRRGPDPLDPHRRRASALPAPGRAPAGFRARRATERAPVEPPGRAAAEALRTAGQAGPSGRRGGRRGDLPRGPARVVRLRDRRPGLARLARRAVRELRDRPLRRPGCRPQRR